MNRTQSLNAKNLSRWDHHYLWHPFTPQQYWEQEKPLIIERGRGCYLYDDAGNRYIDGVSSLWVTVHGHTHPALNRAIRRQLNRIAHSTLLGLSHEPAIVLARDLVRVAPPGLQRVFYSDSGSTAVEIALKMAYQYWANQGQPRKHSFIRMENAYHGDTVGAVSVGGITLFHQVYKPLLFKTYPAPSPYCYRCPLGKKPDHCRQACLDRLEQLMVRRSASTAAFILEPLVQGAAGMITFPPGYLKRARELCQRHQILMIADEVAVGFGRTGALFACEQEEVTPDLLCVGKGITGGYLPLAATLTTEGVYQAFLGRVEEMKTFYHGHTYTGNPLACAAAVENLRLLADKDFFRKLRKKIVRLERLLVPFRDLAHVGEVRQKGFMVGLELVRDRDKKTPYPPDLRLGHRVILEARKYGIIIRPLGDVIVLMPPLTIPEKALKSLVDGTFRAVRDVTEAQPK
ncbi:MAG: adenosylmethionine--8-amino-7-oxononanoate transaminase [Deltaproteobacteria bacterium]|nr:adenosylmethionine--8-amino-7-oxononanoate transaminase [Deltaproteobacteria bacterium]